MPSRIVIWAIMLAAAGGCSRMAPVEGAVTLDGKPLSHATIQLASETDPTGVQPAGSSGEDGSFRVFTKNKAGVVPGVYKVTVTKRQVITAGPKMGANELVPPPYFDAKRSPLQIDVPKGGKKDFVLELTSKSDRPPKGQEGEQQ